MAGSASYFTSEEYKDFSPFEIASAIKDLDPSYADFSIDEIAAAGNELRKQTPWAGGVGTAFTEGLRSAKDMAYSAWSTWTGDLENVEKIYQERETEQITPARFAFHQALEERKAEGDEGILDAIMNGIGAAWEQPTGAFHEFTANLPNMGIVMSSAYAGGKLGAMGGTAIEPGGGTLIGGGIGALTGAILGMFGANTLLETGQLSQQYAAEGFTEEERQAAIQKGFTKAGVLTAVDSATFGASRLLAGVPGRAVEQAIANDLIDKGVDVANKVDVARAFKDPNILRSAFDTGTEALAQTMSRGKRVGRGAAGFGLETVGEAVGEFAGTAAIGETPSYTDAFIEAMLASPFSVSELIVAKKMEQPGTLTQSLQNITGASSVDEALAAADEAVTTAREGVASRTRQVEANKQITLDPNAGLRDPGLSADPAYAEIVASIFQNVKVPELRREEINQIRIDEMQLAREQGRAPLIRDVVETQPTERPELVGPVQPEVEPLPERGRGAPGQIVPDYTVARGRIEDLGGVPVRVVHARGDVIQPTEDWGQPRLAVDHVGEIPDTNGKDGNPITTVMLDDFRNPETPVHVVDEVGEDGSEFVKNTVVYGAGSRAEAMRGYRMSGGTNRVGGIKEMSQAQFKTWVSDPAKIRKKSTLVRYKGGKLTEIGESDRAKRIRLQQTPAMRRLGQRLGVRLPLTTGPVAVESRKEKEGAPSTKEVEARPTTAGMSAIAEAETPVTSFEPTEVGTEPQKVAPVAKTPRFRTDQVKVEGQPSQAQVVTPTEAVTPQAEVTREQEVTPRETVKRLLTKFAETFDVKTDLVREEIIPDTSPLGQLKKQFLEPVLGKRLIVIDDRDAKMPTDGAVLDSDPDVIFIAAGSTKPHLKVLGHELMHTMKGDRPDLYQDTVTALRPLLRDYEKYKQYLARRGPADLSTEAVEEELIADLMGEGFADKEFWKRVKNRSPGLFERVATAIKVYLDHVVKFFQKHKMEGTQYFEDYSKARDVVADALVAYADKGKKTPLNQIEMDREYEVEETGDTVTVTENAATLVREAQNRVKVLSLLEKCIAA